MSLEQTAPGVRRLDILREQVAAAQEEHRIGILAAQQRPRSRWTEAATLVALVNSCIALALAGYAVFGGLARPVPPPDIGSRPVALPAAPPAAPALPALPEIGAAGRIARLATACFDLRDHRRIHELRASDPGAADSYAAQACGAFEPGLPVTVDKTSAPDGALCARQVGHTLCFWVAGDAFAAGQEAAASGTP